MTSVLHYCSFLHLPNLGQVPQFEELVQKFKRARKDPIGRYIFRKKKSFYVLESCISCSQEKRNEKDKIMTSTMASLNLDEDMANKRERK